jgi:hypothetical protein
VTIRSVILGFLGAMGICGVTYFNDWVLRQTHFVGNNMPVVIYGSLILFMLFLNRLLRRWALRGREIVVILALCLAACSVPGSGLLRSFPGTIILPHRYERLEPSWRQHDILRCLPQSMLVDISGDDDRVLDGYVQGLSRDGKAVAVSDIPWHAWRRPCLFWLPIALCMFFAVIGLSLVLHRQWAEHEHLPYPLATFTAALIETDAKGRSSLWHSRLFWLGAGVVFAIHLNNVLATWFPNVLIPFQLRLDFSKAAPLFPKLVRGGGWFILRPRIFFAVIGLSYFTATDLVAAFGFGPIAWAGIAGIFAGYGILMNNSMTGGAYLGLIIKDFVLFGSCAGVFISLVYSGRHYYLAVLRQALGLKNHSAAVEARAVWGLRVCIVFLLLFVALLTRAHIEWQLATIYACVLMIIYLVSARLMAEGGLFHIKIAVFPCVIIWGFFGSEALSFQTILLLQMLSIVLFIDPRETLLPFMVNANKLLAERQLPMGRTATFAGAAIVLGLLIAVPATLYIQYNVPATIQTDISTLRKAKVPFETAVAVKQRLEARGTLEQAVKQAGWGRFAAMRPLRPCLWGFAAGALLVVVAAFCRMRFPRWPIHPLLFVVWTQPHITLFCFSFILGWIAKLCILKYGNSQLYGRIKPLMMGLIAGEILGAMAPSLIGVIYYYVTGNIPKPYVLYMG